MTTCVRGTFKRCLAGRAFDRRLILVGEYAAGCLRLVGQFRLVVRPRRRNMLIRLGLPVNFTVFRIMRPCRDSARRSGGSSRQPRRMAIPAGFEPATRGVEIRYSIQLSYGTVASAFYHRSWQKAVSKKRASASNRANSPRRLCDRRLYCPYRDVSAAPLPSMRANFTLRALSTPNHMASFCDKAMGASAWRFPLCSRVTIGMQRTGILPDHIGNACNGNGRFAPSARHPFRECWNRRRFAVSRRMP